MPQASEKLRTSDVVGLDGLTNYHLHEEVGRGMTSIVYRAICRRGRLRNRIVALKIKKPSNGPGDGNNAALPSSPSAIHYSLHHPAIVSLLSHFTCASGRFHVLEFCSRGSLEAFLHSREGSRTSEGELRGVGRSLVDALLYLKKERVVHRAICPGNILLTEDLRVKLSDFGLSARLPIVSSAISGICDSPNYVAPEIISRLPHGPSVDLWSLGCVLLRCLSGRTPFKASTADEVYANVTRGEYTLPEVTSQEAKDLLSGLIQVDPADRIPLYRIPTHPFF